MRRAEGGARADVLPPGWNARSRVHEYGGRAWIPVGDGGLVFANWDDQRLYLLEPGAAGEPRPLTPRPVDPQGERYADLVLGRDGREVLCVRERAADGRAVTHDIVAVALDGSFAVRTLVVDGHFVSNPRPSPDGRHLSWLTWDHPRMPWDGTELRVGEIGSDGSIGVPRTLLGGEEESVFQPEWADDGALYAVSDRDGWWNLYKVGLTGDVETLCERAEELGRPQWIFGMATYGVLGDGRVVMVHAKGTWTMSLLDPATRAVHPASPELSGRFSYFEPVLAVHDRLVAVVGGGPVTPTSVVSLDTRTGNLEVLRCSVDEAPDPRYLPVARPDTFRDPSGRDVHAFVYTPKNPEFTGPKTAAPPYVVFVHGGPTGQISPALDLQVAYFTSRGIGVVGVDYGGSTGYGREYRNRLRGQWGVVDVEDVVAVARSLAERGEADPRRLLIRGASAGGWTVLAALTRTDVFAGGVSYYGVADLTGLVEDTHDFESHYIDLLVGPWPEARHLYEERSPLSHVDELDCPILLLQGTEDKIVTPRQAEMFRDAMVRRGIAHAYVVFEGEQHGFRRSETIERALEAELSFYGQVIGFEPPGVPRLVLTRGGR
ncbi:MAG: prolyl oligopeptidase family serine peptidase [Acidimicrobiales bacterium]